MGDGAGNPTGNDAMSTSGDSVNQNVPLQPPGEAIGGSLAPQDNVLPAVGTYDSAPTMVNVGAQHNVNGAPSGSMEVIGSAQVGGYDPSQSFGSYQQTQGSYVDGSSGMAAASATMAAAASVVMQTAMNVAQQSVIAGQ